MASRFSIVGSIAVFMGMAIFSVSALVGAQDVGTESLEVPVGTIFEIVSDADIDASLSWVLTQERTFVEASRDRAFRIRFSQPGIFVLEAQVETDTDAIRREIEITVRPRTSEDNELPSQDGTEGVVAFDPAPDGDDILLDESQQIILARPLRADIKGLAIDLDTSRDSNSDGKVNNDDDTRGTLFQTERNPLYIWFISPDEFPKTIRLGALFENGKTYFHSFVVDSSAFVSRPDTEENSFPEEPPSESGRGSIVVVKSDNGKLQLAVQDDRDNEPRLYQWNFGDGQQSLLDRPVHTFATSGTYTVSVTIRDLETGEIIDTITDEIVVNRMREEPEPGEEEPEPEPQPEEEPKDESSGGGSMLWTIAKILMTLLLSVGIGLGVTFVIGKLRKGKPLSEKFAEAESALFKGSTEIPTDVLEITSPVEVPTPSAPAPTPPAPSAPSVPPREESAPKTTPSESAPDWLQKGSQAESPKVETPTTGMDTGAPDWLKGTSESGGSQMPTSGPDWLRDSAEKTPHEPLTPSVAELKTAEENAPAWLKTGIEKAAVVSQTPASPPPPPLQDTSTAATPVAPPRAPEEKPTEEVTVSLPEPEPPAPTVPEPPAPAATEPVAPTPKATVALSKTPEIPRTPSPPTEPKAEKKEETASAADDGEKEARVREKKREKRRRYRENKKKRGEVEETLGEPAEVEKTESVPAAVKEESTEMATVTEPASVVTESVKPATETSVPTPAVTETPKPEVPAPEVAPPATETAQGPAVDDDTPVAFVKAEEIGAPPALPPPEAEAPDGATPP